MFTMRRSSQLLPFALAVAIALIISGTVHSAMPPGADTRAARLPDGAPAVLRRAVADYPAVPATEVCGPLESDTTWSTAGSPYVTTCDVEVPEGVTLSIEPGVVVELGYYHRLLVSGRLMAIGTEDEPISFASHSPDDPANAWDSVQLEAGSGPSEIAHARFTGGGAGRHEMLGISSDAALIRDTLFTEGVGIGVEIKAGASPTIQDSVFLLFEDRNPTPPAALRIRGASNAAILRCVFQSNIYAVYWDANVSPRFENNRFIYNGLDGVLVYGRVTRDVTMPSLGPRVWGYELLQNGLVIDAEGHLTIEPGATLRFSGGTGIRVAGTLSIRGEAANKVLLTTNSPNPEPGKWNEIEFLPDSVDYNPGSGGGSIIDHAILEYGGAKQIGVVHIRNAAPRISNTTISHCGQRGITLVGPESRPQLVGNLFDANVDDPDGVAVFATGQSAPELSFNIFRNNFMGVRSEEAAAPIVEPHNWFNRNLSHAVNNTDRTVCVEATGNDWNALNGPRDRSELPTDACGEGKNDGDGDRVSNHVRYTPFEGTLARPEFSAPRCGTIGNPQPTIEGLAPPGSTVIVYDNQEQLGVAQAGTGSGEMAPFSYQTPVLAPGSHVLHLRAERDSLSSGISEPLELLVDPQQVIDAGGLYVSYDLDGTHYVQPYQNAQGCLTLRSGDWMIRPHPPDGEMTLHVPVSCPSGATPAVTGRYNEEPFSLQPVGDGGFEGSFDPEWGAREGGPLSLVVDCGSASRDVLLGTVAIEYNGLVFDEEIGPQYGRIRQATVTLWKWDTSNYEWGIWSGEDYFGQTNPQTTGLGGWYGFYPQPGYYRAHITAAGYEDATTSEVTIKAQPFVENVPMKAKPSIYLPATYRTHSLPR